ncbi:MAG: hypothetical protein R3345_15370 [Fulvivirga sp.]|nr:hypothetical protein [Fulvivirga sp.]
MKLLGSIFLVIAAICLVIIIFGLYSTGRTDDYSWLVTGPPIIASFALGAGIALLAASKKRKE